MSKLNELLNEYFNDELTVKEHMEIIYTIPNEEIKEETQKLLTFLNDRV